MVHRAWHLNIQWLYMYAIVVVLLPSRWQAVVVAKPVGIRYRWFMIIECVNTGTARLSIIESMTQCHYQLVTVQLYEVHRLCHARLINNYFGVFDGDPTGIRSIPASKDNY